MPRPDEPRRASPDHRPHEPAAAGGIVERRDGFGAAGAAPPGAVPRRPKKGPRCRPCAAIRRRLDRIAPFRSLRGWFRLVVRLAGRELRCDLLLAGAGGVADARVRLAARAPQPATSRVIEAEKVAPYLAPALLRPRSRSPGARTARKLDFSAISTTMAGHRDGRSARLRIAAVLPCDMLDDLSLEAVEINRLSADAEAVDMSADTHDMLLIVPDGSRYENGWQSQFFRPGAAGKLAGAIATARQARVPVVVWLTSHPLHADRLAWLHDQADLLCASEEAQVDPAAMLRLPVPFQPCAFNPFTACEDTRLIAESQMRVFLDGWWTATGALQDDPQLDLLKPDLSIVDSVWEHAESRDDDSARFRHNSLGCISHAERAIVAKFWDRELIVPDQTLSPATLKKRAREAIGANCYPVAHSPQLHDRLIGDLVPHRPAGSRRDDAGQPDPADLLRARRDLHLARRNLLLSGATYADCLNEVADGLGLERASDDTPLVTIVLVSRRPRLLRHCLDRIGKQTYPKLEFIYVLHGHHAEHAWAHEKVRAAGGEFLHLDSSLSLGACLNIAVGHAAGTYVAKMDDDDIYGENYILDLMLCRRFLRFDFIGKPSAFFLSAPENRLFFDPGSLGREWKYAHPSSERVLSAGAAVMVRRSVFEEVRYPEARRGGADSAFARRCQRAGITTYSADLFNFVVYRDANTALHTWRVPDRRSAALLDVTASLSLADIMV